MPADVASIAAQIRTLCVDAQVVWTFDAASSGCANHVEPDLARRQHPFLPMIVKGVVIGRHVVDRVITARP